jgi:hypothetical protein
MVILMNRVSSTELEPHDYGNNENKNNNNNNKEICNIM